MEKTMIMERMCAGLDLHSKWRSETEKLEIDLVENPEPTAFYILG
jgi:hypothetical protein